MTNLTATPENFCFTFTVLELKIAKSDGTEIKINYNEDIKPTQDDGYDTPEEYLENVFWENTNISFTVDDKKNIQEQIIINWRNQLTKDIEFYKEETAEIDLIKNLDIDKFANNLLMSQIHKVQYQKEYYLLSNELQSKIQAVISNYIDNMFTCEINWDEEDSMLLFNEQLNRNCIPEQICLKDIKQLLR